MKGIINSFQSMGAVDGPGLRFVIFMQGCPLRCVYCHNPETWALTGPGSEIRGSGIPNSEISSSETLECAKGSGGEEGMAYEPEEVLERILRYKPFIAKTGGVTLSGGEPLLQWPFAVELFKLLKKEGLHTALDTSGVGDINGAAELLQYTDLVLCDLKFTNNEDYQRYCWAKSGSSDRNSGSGLSKVLEFLHLTEDRKVPLWIRHVVVPGLTDGTDHIMKLARMAGRFTNLEKLELLPFRKLCLSKYENMGLTFPLKDVEECSEEKLRQLNLIIQL